MIIIRDESERVVILSYADYSAVAETGYLLRNPVIAKRLRESLESFHNQGGIGYNFTVRPDRFSKPVSKRRVDKAPAVIHLHRIQSKVYKVGRKKRWLINYK